MNCEQLVLRLIVSESTHSEVSCSFKIQQEQNRSTKVNVYDALSKGHHKPKYSYVKYLFTSKTKLTPFQNFWIYNQLGITQINPQFWLIRRRDSKVVCILVPVPYHQLGTRLHIFVCFVVDISFILISNHVLFLFHP